MQQQARVARRHPGRSEIFPQGKEEEMRKVTMALMLLVVLTGIAMATQRVVVCEGFFYTT